MTLHWRSRVASLFSGWGSARERRSMHVVVAELPQDMRVLDHKWIMLKNWMQAD